MLGTVVLAGIPSVMIGLGLALYLLNRSFSSILDRFLPLIYGVVIPLGIAMLLGRNPFSDLSTSTNPIRRSHLFRHTPAVCSLAR